ncbi:MAG: hypothetical protein J6D34_02170 [Atopobiaceae bacterium]|nr:hypothetical protein [Atopobiaceae bacterium]
MWLTLHQFLCIDEQDQFGAHEQDKDDQLVKMQGPDVHDVHHAEAEGGGNGQLHDQQSQEAHDRGAVDKHARCTSPARDPDDKVIDADERLHEQDHLLDCQEDESLQSHRYVGLGVHVCQVAQGILGLGAEHAKQQANGDCLHEQKLVRPQGIGESGDQDEPHEQVVDVCQVKPLGSNAKVHDERGVAGASIAATVDVRSLRKKRRYQPMKLNLRFPMDEFLLAVTASCLVGIRRIQQSWMCLPILRRLQWGFLSGVS